MVQGWVFSPTWIGVAKSTDLSGIFGEVRGMKLNNFCHGQIKGYSIQILINFSISVSKIDVYQVFGIVTELWDDSSQTGQKMNQVKTDSQRETQNTFNEQQPDIFISAEFELKQTVQFCGYF